MDQIKTGKFIAELRKKKGLTQIQLAQTLGITDRAISKWERGKGMPDSSIMLDLCNELEITANELLNGEKIEMENYNEIAEMQLVEFKKKEEENNKRLLFFEKVIGLSSTLSYIVLIFAGVFATKILAWRIALIAAAFILLLIGVSFALKIETEAGYYECQNCHNKYVPKYSSVYFAMHMGTTRYLKCPECNKRSWSKKVLK
ncbi:MAG: helix-turn-helix domain-containing protein [Eubacterium sp.]